MALRKFWTIAYRDLMRNGRRTALTIVAIALSMVVLVMLSSFLRGVLGGALDDNIRLATGHLQLRAASYEPEKQSLLARDLLPDVDSLVSRVQATDGVVSASPILWAGGMLSTADDSAGIQIKGINPADSFHDPVRQGVIEGQYLSQDGRGELLIGRRLANRLGISAGQRVSLAAGDANGGLNEGIFTVVGVYSTGIPAFDQNAAYMSLDQAQAFMGTGDRASTIITMVDDNDTAAAVARTLAAPGLSIPTWEELNQTLLQTTQAGAGFYYLLYLIIILVVAVLIANTLLMSVFERTREIGILSALGMNRRQLMISVLFEAVILTVAGVIIGIIVGLGVVAYLARFGVNIGEDAAAMAGNFAYRSTLYAAYDPLQYLILAVLLFVIVLVVSLYPAWYAAKMEPVKALHAL